MTLATKRPSILNEQITCLIGVFYVLPLITPIFTNLQFAKTGVISGKINLHVLVGSLRSTWKHISISLHHYISTSVHQYIKIPYLTTLK
jgi:hypothetical protein